MRKRITLTGSMLRARDAAFKSAIAQNLEKHIWPLLATGHIKPIVYKTFPVQQAAQASPTNGKQRAYGEDSYKLGVVSWQ